MQTCYLLPKMLPHVLVTDLKPTFSCHFHFEYILHQLPDPRTISPLRVPRFGIVKGLYSTFKTRGGKFC